LITVSAFEAKRKSEGVAELERVAELEGVGGIKGVYRLIPIPPLFYKNVKKGGDGY